MKTWTFISAVKDFFGLKPNQGLQDFLAEVKQLTPEDRVEFTEQLRLAGYNIQ